MPREMPNHRDPIYWWPGDRIDPPAFNDSAYDDDMRRWREDYPELAKEEDEE